MPIWYAPTMSGTSCSATITGMYSIPAGPFASQPLRSYIASCDFTQRFDHSGVTRFQNWLRFQNVFQNASQPNATSPLSLNLLTFSSASRQLPSTSLNVFLLSERYILV